MEVLAEKTFWDARYDPENVPEVLPAGDPRRSFYAFTRGYDEYVLWNGLYEKHMPRGPEKKIIEIGSAPGYYLVQLHQRFGLDPYGIEYSEPGVAQNRAYFSKYGLNPDQIILADFFDDDFLAEHAGQYDAVVSRGFIEHFTDIQPVIDRHVWLLKEGGTLFLTIPNFRGVYGAWMRRFQAELLAIHNTDIMRLDAFRDAFDRPDLDAHFCDHYGTFHLGRFQAEETHPLLHRLLKNVHVGQFGLNALFRLVFGQKGPNHPSVSPFLQYVGTRRG